MSNPGGTMAWRQIAVVAALSVSFLSGERIRVSPEVQERRLILRVPPACPEPARYYRIRGRVDFSALIGTDGSVKRLRLISGHPLLVAAARAAIRQWRYRPTRVAGEPVEVLTGISLFVSCVERPPAIH